MEVLSFPSPYSSLTFQFSTVLGRSASAALHIFEKARGPSRRCEAEARPGFGPGRFYPH